MRCSVTTKLWNGTLKWTGNKQLIDLIEQHEAAEQRADGDGEQREDEMPPNNDGVIRAGIAGDLNSENGRQYAA